MSGKITPAQVKRIHTLKGALKLTDLQYRAALEFYHVFSSLQLNEVQADQLILELEAIAIRAGKWDRPYRKYQQLDGRRGMATSRQLRMLEAMWRQVTRAVGQADQDAAFRTFLCRWNIGRIEEITSRQVSKLVLALEAMKKEAR